MKKLSFFVLTVLVFNAFITSAQNAYTTMTVGGSTINFSAPTTEYKEVVPSQRDQFSSFLPPSNSMLCVYLDTFDLKKLLIRETDSIKMDKYMLIEINKNLVESNCSDSNFAMVKRDAFESLKNDSKQLMDDANNILKEIIDEKEDVNLNHLKTMGILYDNKETCGMLMSFVVKNGNKSVKKLCSVNFLKLNNRLIYMYVFTTFNDISKVKWVKDISISWANDLLEANK